MTLLSTRAVPSGQCGVEHPHGQAPESVEGTHGGITGEEERQDGGHERGEDGGKERDETASEGAECGPEPILSQVSLFFVVD